MKRLTTIGAVAALAGGVMRVIAAFIPHTAGSPWLEAYYALIDTCLLIGLIGIYHHIGDRLGWPGLIGFLVAAVAQGSIIGPDAVRFGIDFYLACSVVLLAGLAILSVAILVTRTMLAVAALWLASLGLAAASLVIGEMAVLAAGALLGAGFACAGADILNRPGTIRSPTPALLVVD